MKSSRFATPYRTLLLLVMLVVVWGSPATRIAAQTCSGTFSEHALPHTTQSRGSAVRFYESNGSGVAINDLNGDGLLDIVLGNLDRPNQILWNEGGLAFRAQEFARPNGRARAVQTVDVDADGWLDILFTNQVAAPQYWRNNGDETFTLTPLGNVLRPASTIAWVDPDRDGDLDLVTASYDAELLQLLRDSFLNSGGAGVIYYENTPDGYQSTRLAEQAQALALSVSDLNGDGQLDLVVGNDFSLPDQSWTFVDGVWQPITLFASTTFSTMSFDAGDINNDGRLEFFAADMHPVGETPDELAAWRYVLADLEARAVLPGDTQASRNMLFSPVSTTADNLMIDQAEDFGIAATGWTWSSKFGDLDQDGYLDLYIVNGMASVELFGHLPDDELIEPNYAFRNEGGACFVPAPEWGLTSLSGGRGMSMGDLDNDGDLDIVVNNLNTPAQLFENQLCSGASLQVELRAPGVPNLFGIGARLVLHTTSGTYTREMQAASGYLSGDPARVHFGFPADAQLEQLDIYWPDGGVTTVTEFGSSSLVLVNRKSTKAA